MYPECQYSESRVSRSPIGCPVLNPAAIDQHANNLLHEGRVALRLGENQLSQVFRKRLHVQQVANKLFTIIVRRTARGTARSHLRPRTRDLAESASTRARSLSCRVTYTITSLVSPTIDRTCKPNSTDEGSAQWMSSQTMIVGADCASACISRLVAEVLGLKGRARRGTSHVRRHILLQLDSQKMAR